MNIISGKYAVSCTPEGSYYAYSLMHEQCCAYGESEEKSIIERPAESICCLPDYGLHLFIVSVLSRV